MPADENQPGWSEALKRIKDADSPRVLRLDLAGLHLAALPASLFDLRYVRELNLSGNDLTSIPDSIASLRYLQELIVSDNRIVRLPQSLAELPSLRLLVASNNQIVELPETFRDLHTLEILILSVNRIPSIPASMSALARLRQLDLSYNSLTEIPQLSFPELQKLNLASNDLRFLHDGRLSLPSLRYLNLSKNRLRIIPVSVKHFPQLTELYLHDNADLEIPADILGSSEAEVRDGHHEPKSPKEILDYYLETRTGSRPLNEGKLIFVGQGAVGKTSLVKALAGGGFDTREPNTEGIQITDWSCALSTGATKVHVWDFGGQEMMHSTHRFFLTERSLYVLVLNRRLGGSDEQADYWLRLIRTFGGRNAPVIVVLNKQKREPFDVNRGAWLEKYPDNIKGFVQTDCIDEASILELRNRLVRQLEDLESIKAKFPTRWFLIKDELSQLRTDYLTLEEYRTLCASYGEPESGNQSSLAGFLHDLGIALNYRHDARLRFYVLKPAWVTDGIYTLLHAFAGQNGLFNVDDAGTALARHGYTPEATDFILTLMEQFELSFSFGERQRQILVPQLLAEQQPEATREFDIAACLNYGYKYEIVPEGLLPRFIVRTHHLSEAAYRWKHGVVLTHQSSGCRALVRALPSDHEVRIHVNGPEENRRDLLAIVRYNFEVIHADYDSRPEELIFAPGVAQKPVSLRVLRTRANNNRTTIDIELDGDELVETSIASLTEPLNTPAPLRLFLSYSHADEEYIERLRKELKLMERNGLIRPWYDRALNAGEQWEPRILQELENADAVLVQLSPDFLASDFCVLNELATAIRRKKNGETELIAYVLRECGWKQVDGLGQFQMLPRELKPLRSWRDRDQYWRAVAEGIEQSLRSLRALKPPVESLKPRVKGFGST